MVKNKEEETIANKIEMMERVENFYKELITRCRNLES